MFADHDTKAGMLAVRGGAIVVAFLLLFFASRSAGAAVNVILPDPAGTTDGIPNAFRWGDAWVYPMKLLHEWQEAELIPEEWGDYQAAAGTGTLDIKIGTGGNVKNDVTVNGSTWSFEDAQDLPNVADFWGPLPADGNIHWGDKNATKFVEGPVYVKDLLDFLQAVDPSAKSPILFKDMNQTGAGGTEDFFFYERIEIRDGLGGDVLAYWEMKDPPGGLESDILGRYIGSRDPVLAHGIIHVGSGNPLIDTPFPIASTSGDEYEVDNNLGSGKPDFAVYFPTMDLTLYDDDNNIFVVLPEGGAKDSEFSAEPYYGQGNDGYEEQWIRAGVSVIPEPASVVIWALLGAMGFGLGWWRWRRTSSNAR